MSIASEIARLQQAKADLKTAINSKGGNITTERIDQFASEVASLPSPKEEETKTLTPDFSSGNQVIVPTSDKVLSQVTLIKPAQLIPENIKEDVDICGVVGTLESGGGVDTSLIYQDLEDEYSLEITNVDVSYKYLVVFCRAQRLYPESMIYIYHDGSSWKYNRDFYRYDRSSVSVSVTDDNLILNLYCNENTSSNLHAYIFKVVSEFPTPVPIKNNYYYICFIKDTPITLADRTYKLVQDITYQDDLLVWDFDNATFTSAKPIWIMKQKRTLKYNHLVFSDGSELNTVNQHRIFNVEKGMFTYPMTDDTPLGTTTFNDKGEYVTLVSKEVINKEVEYHNIITDYHMNLFAGTILTSCRYNNIYPIQDMKFVKEFREHKSIEYFDVPEKYYYGLRLYEQPDEPTSINKVDMTTKEYVDRLERSKL